MTTSRERVAKHRKAKRDAGLVRLPETWVPADKLDDVRAAIDAVVTRDQVAAEAAFKRAEIEKLRRFDECNKMTQADWLRNHPGGF